MTITNPYYCQESNCKECGSPIIRYSNLVLNTLVPRENWHTSTGWQHKDDLSHLCFGDEIEDNGEIKAMKITVTHSGIERKEI